MYGSNPNGKLFTKKIRCTISEFTMFLITVVRNRICKLKLFTTIKKNNYEKN
jgi:hypothetical protein